ncbi:MAG: SRPBCC family protein [Cyanobacteria bacterium]|nr:SRPBCC family protein [Cyanobacteriota bacterium]
MTRVTRILAAAMLCGAPAPALAQAPAPAPTASVVVANPTYTTIPLEIDVNKPAAEVWARVGKYCDIAEWLPAVKSCKMLSGVEGEVGSVRSVANEVLVAKTQYSYTYTQTPREVRPYNLYHGTVEVRPVTDKTSKIVYTLMYDNSMLPDDGAREKDKAARTAMFTGAIQNMKTLVESGKPRP